MTLLSLFCFLGNDLLICPKDNGKQCCSRRMEDRFASFARGDFDQAVSKKVEELGNLFGVQAKIFDGKLFAVKCTKCERVWIKFATEKTR